MTGYPQFNFPLFKKAAAELRAEGMEIHSPNEADSPAVQAAALASKDGQLDANGKVAGETWGDILSKDVKIVADLVDGIVFLPNWQDSKGARLEAFVALLTGKHNFMMYEDRRPMERYEVWDKIRVAMQ